MKNKTKLKLHPLCSLFPELPAAELAELAESIKLNGQEEPITLLDGQILDGQNRYAACQIAGVEPITKGFVGENPVEYVIKMNLKRRHLSDGQRALIAAEIANLRRGENKLADSVTPTAEQAATALNVSTRSVERARKVRDKAAQPLKKLVRNGEVSIDAASKVASLSKEKQRKIAERGADAVKNAAARLKQRPPRGGFQHEAGEKPPVSFADNPPATNYVRGQKPPPKGNGAPAAEPVALGEVVDAESAIARVEACYAAHKAFFNTPPPPSPRVIVDRIIEALRA